MGASIGKLLPRVFSGVLIAGAALLSVGVSKANNVEYAAIADGTLGGNSTNCDTSDTTTSVSFQGLTYSCGSFDVVSFPDGTIVIGGDALNNMGSFTLNTSIETFNNVPFSLLLSFSLPGIFGDTFTATINGVVTSNPRTSAVSIVWAQPDPHDYPNYQFTLGPDNLGISPGQTKFISGHGLDYSPEPGTMALIGSGLIAAGLISRRRKKT